MVHKDTGGDPKEPVLDAIDQQLDCASQFPEETAPADLRKDFKIRSEMAKSVLAELLEPPDDSE
jgi:hypothetical protein